VKQGTVVHINSREVHILEDREGWALVIRIKGWLRPRLDVERQPVPTRPDPGRSST
jgi:hypothetical protein